MDDDLVQSHDKRLLCDRFVNIVYIYILYMQIQLNLKECYFILPSLVLACWSLKAVQGVSFKWEANKTTRN